MLERWTRGVIRHRFTVIAVWLVLIMAGPGAIATVIAIGNSDRGVVRVADVIIILVLSLMTFRLLLLAEPIERVLGDQGLMVLTRIFGLLLLAIGVSTIMSALTSAFPGLS